MNDIIKKYNKIVYSSKEIINGIIVSDNVLRLYYKNVKERTFMPFYSTKDNLCIDLFLKNMIKVNNAKCYLD
jgi:hypothetical protein